MTTRPLRNRLRVIKWRVLDHKRHFQAIGAVGVMFGCLLWVTGFRPLLACLLTIAFIAIIGLCRWMAREPAQEVDGFAQRLDDDGCSLNKNTPE